MEPHGLLFTIRGIYTRLDERPDVEDQEVSDVIMEYSSRRTTRCLRRTITLWKRPETVD